MLFVRDKGQMCNNIYQYIKMYAWARKHNLKSMSMRFAHKYKGFAICHTPYHNKTVYILVKALKILKLIPVVNYEDENTTAEECERRLLSSRSAIVEGWNVGYNDLLPEYMNEIRQLFAFDGNITAAARRNMLPAGDTTVSIGLHIRRGDYKSFMGGRHYFTDKDFMDCLALLLDNFKESGATSICAPTTRNLTRNSFCAPYAAKRNGTTATSDSLMAADRKTCACFPSATISSDRSAVTPSLPQCTGKHAASG